MGHHGSFDSVSRNSWIGLWIYSSQLAGLNYSHHCLSVLLGTSKNGVPF